MAINRMNLVRVKYTILTFLLLEIMMLTFHLMKKEKSLLEKPSVYYGSMYVLMIIVMLGFGIAFMMLKKDMIKNLLAIRVTGTFFISFILFWCATITLIDLSSNGQFMVYVSAIFAISVVPFFKPITNLLVYSLTHLYYLILLPYTIPSFSNYINPTTFVIFAWVIASIRFKKQVEDFNNQKTIKSQNIKMQKIIKELAEVNQSLEILSQRDSLTGAYNRMMFRQKLQEEWAISKNNHQPLSLIMIDVDLFKQINDTLGHQAGDAYLKQIANIIINVLNRPNDMVARLGGDEFIILLPNTDLEKAIAIGEKIRSKVEEHGISESLRLVIPPSITISVGVKSMIPSEKTLIEDFLNETDKALYKAKERRNACEAA